MDGTGFQITSAGNSTADNRSDVIAYDSTGRLCVYPGNGTGRVGTYTRTGNGRSGYLIV